MNRNENSFETSSQCVEIKSNNEQDKMETV